MVERSSSRKTRVGVVVSDKMDKTVVVAVRDTYRHPLYGKTQRRLTKYKAHDDGVALLDLHGRNLAAVGGGHDHNTSGASEMIRMTRLSRSSRPTGPKMRVPRGSPLSRMMTAAFSSKRM